MKFLRNTLDKMHPLFDKGGKLEKLYPLYEAADTFLYTPGQVAKGLTHVRDSLDLKRMMTMVVVALIPCVFMAMWNTGYQANLAIQAIQEAGLEPAFDWHNSIHSALGLAHDPGSFLDNLVYGAIFFLPVYIVCMTAGGLSELVFSMIRGHEINEGFLVTGLLFPLTLPPDIPLWQVAVGIMFGVVIGKEIFGGTGRNFLNPALTARAFLYFAYAGQISGDKVWTAAKFVRDGAVDGYSGATALGWLGQLKPKQVDELGSAMESLQHIATTGGEQSVSWMSSFLGTIPGSMGETSALACLIGAVILIATGIGSWRIMAGVCIGAAGLASLLYIVGSETNPMFQVPPWWHFVIGGFAFGTVFMATDPVSASMTETGKWYYGGLIGAMTILIRAINPAFPEGIMLAILFGNVFAPLIDYFVVQANIKRRALRYAA
ncbi:NADH:ubiquinone reductase (Na(+)-transporting) subunit B [Aureliella helgolandensis]|uniref:Na(+)-translocating NADH-quinone reductase subunit B n=1 Tax=Aureliella helgolandensis TaxID=2527968 RepID=A0A518GGG2_9BACT|nr:NADH:ubiquinone reductase (Na(+)-transporting) subunit B [Aureliella helgolandensis]QDV27638.1 Na(+)-translocating NADH-quinone reductase subunit B [Aureliella helgolandensis]